MTWIEAFYRFKKAKSNGFQFQFDKNLNYYTQKSYKNGTDYGFHYEKNENFKAPYIAKPVSHDDGPFNGPFLGGIGTSNYSRDFTGKFNRWHLQKGVHQNEVIESAFFMIRWEIDGKAFYKRLRIGEGDFAATEIQYATLFPLVYEYYNSEQMPFELLFEYYSPIIPHNYKDSSLPITCFNFHVKSKVDKKIDISIGLVWPNLIGWKLPFMASEARQGRQWPNHQNANNVNELVKLNESTCHIAQYKNSPINKDTDMLGKVLLTVNGNHTWNLSYYASFRANQITTGIKEHEQKYTLAQMEHIFKTSGKLPNNNIHWEAHWHEPLASAIAGKKTIGAGEESKILFNLVMDIPITTFGSRRNWYKVYTKYYGKNYENTLELANRGMQMNASWIHDISSWHDNELTKNDYLPSKIKGAKINELYFIVAGGTVWLRKNDENVTETESPILHEEEFIGILEGFDTGYYYYNTLDLWVYAFIALSENWPKLSHYIFRDFLNSTKYADERRQLIYRTGTLERNLIDEKLPHDFGSAPQDPWYQTNGYTHRDDPNLWKDHNPSFVVSFYYHKQLLKEEVTQEEFDTLAQVMNFTDEQDTEDIGVPIHSDFGDSTWDNVDMKGLSTYASSLCLSSWYVLYKLAQKLKDSREQYYYDKFKKVQQTIDRLWSGKYYRATSEGKYKNAVMADSLFGVFLAKKAGLGDLISVEKVKSHLLTIFDYNLMSYHNGEFGPLLIAEEGIQNYDGDGGETIQVNEVIVGSAWAYTAMLYEYGLNEEGDFLSNKMRNMIYGNTGLQFRTPAAWDSKGYFRAPLNMRPLAIWML